MVTTWLVLAASTIAAPLPDQFNFQFRIGLEDQPALKLFGPSAKQVARTDEQGLTISLPSKRLDKSGVGVEPRLAIHGDFEATLTCDLLAVEEPPPSGAGVSLWFKFRSSPAKAVSITRLRRADAKGFKDTFGANLITPGPGGKDKYKTKNIPATDKRGRFRVTRVGGTLHYFAADGPNADFQEFHSLEVGNDDIASIRVMCVAGGSPAAVEVRLVDLSLRAERLAKQPVTKTPSAKIPGAEKFPEGKVDYMVPANPKDLDAAIQAAPEGPQLAPRKRWGVFLGVIPCVLLALVLVIRWLLKSRGWTEPPGGKVG